GSVLVGSHELIERAHRWRKMAGGGMRQAGILAAAGVYALKQHVVRLAEDHQNAKVLAEGLSTIGGLDVELDTVETNMVFVTSDLETQPHLIEILKERGVLVGGYGQLRLVTHHDIDAEDVSVVIDAFRKAVLSCKAIRS
ncbi:MAG: beta-eliminating lyase-related protein, partial [Desulfuromonadales bacterium]|nr:beta-eliminating lyase-related protein [Desulfuromonadales bacterium]